MTLDNADYLDNTKTMEGNLQPVNLPSLIEKLNHQTEWEIKKYKNDEDFKNGKEYETVKINGNLLTNAGINFLWQKAIGGAGQIFDNTHAYLAVGTNATAAAATDTTLGTETARVIMDSTYPTQASQQLVLRATFDGSTANVHWQEFGALNAASSGTLLNHKISDQGTKTTGQTWQLTLTITLS